MHHSGLTLSLPALLERIQPDPHCGDSVHLLALPPDLPYSQSDPMFALAPQRESVLIRHHCRNPRQLHAAVNPVRPAPSITPLFSSTRINRFRSNTSLALARAIRTLAAHILCAVTGCTARAAATILVSPSDTADHRQLAPRTGVITLSSRCPPNADCRTQ
ncbi:hypothetical protein CXB77_14070 [Chromatium okenii]|uniref:Uncharacterized protein n=1 Tax=Chromatium okenii TaxID=61644 RepID=A0A2S7XNQ7_9GAMM|nr:hypothetical protein CXB77_14070 [Chromatium okenii]